MKNYTHQYVRTGDFFTRHCLFLRILFWLPLSRFFGGSFSHWEIHDEGKTIWWFPARHGATHKWMVFVRENPNLKWMRTRGTPICGNPHIQTVVFIGFSISMGILTSQKKVVFGFGMTKMMDLLATNMETDGRYGQPMALWEQYGNNQ